MREVSWELSEIGFRGTAGGSLSTGDLLSKDDGDSFSSKVLPRRGGGGAGFLSMVFFLVNFKSDTHSGSESAEKGLDLR